MPSIWRRLSDLERWRRHMTTAMDALVANETSQEQIVAAVAADNADIHRQLTDALAGPQLDQSVIQGIADKIAASNAKLASLTSAPNPGVTTSTGTPGTGTSRPVVPPDGMKTTG
jgi:hypothetical protein